ncbi:MAG: hypothetical protein A2W31_14240 [Planctomycetes bacterium RBG_16_64_10]|nr:MAG: hypothetical protein A2W31_14240 [Planctomycetes bacterium RBG_16_64_10]
MAAGSQYTAHLPTVDSGRIVTHRMIFALLLGLAVAAALAFRLPALSNRPMHADEAVHAARFRDLWQQGRFRYDPNEYHGPTLAYATLPVVWANAAKTYAETTAVTYRLVPALFGAGLVLLLCLLVDAVGKSAAWSAGVLTAISPAMVFYSRYYIHEMLLVFFTLAAVATAWRYLQTKRLVWCLAAGASAGMMQATKETSVLIFAALAMAGAVMAIGNRGRPAACAGSLRRTPRWHLAAGLLAAVLVAVLLLSSFLTNARGPLDGLRTYRPWLGRAGGQSPHVHPWYFYLHMLACWRRADGPWWSEGLVLGLAAIGLLAAWLPSPRALLPPSASPRFVRWFGLYTLMLTAAYSIIPYKTPWCLLGFHHALILLAGVGVAVLLRLCPSLPRQGLVAIVLLVAATQLAWQSYRASYVLCSDPRNPYVYAHTVADINRLAGDVDRLAQAAPDTYATRVDVIWTDHYYWPLPWYLRRFNQVGYWNHVPEGAAVPIVISGPQFDVALTAKLEATHLMTGYYGIRPNVLAQLWVRMDVWEAHLRR